MNNLLNNQEEIKQRAFAEAMRYMDNAKELLKKSRKDDFYYEDKKYVRISCGTAYHAVLIALDAYLELKGVPSPPPSLAYPLSCSPFWVRKWGIRLSPPD
jgi:glucosamine 6-phosphate synthetase-like amidotransferase/phosphosugar isomerase protein